MLDFIRGLAADLAMWALYPFFRLLARWERWVDESADMYEFYDIKAAQDPSPS